MTIKLTPGEIAELIRVTRADVQRLYNLHLKSVETNGVEGFKCLNPEELERQLNRTDKEVLDDFARKGYDIDGADEYIASLNITE